MSNNNIYRIKGILFGSIFALILCLFLSSCISAGKPSTFYTLQSYNTQDTIVKDTHHLNILINKIDIPAYLDKPQIITINSDGITSTHSEFNRWNESLSGMIQRTIATDIENYSPQTKAKSKANNYESYDYQVYIEITKLDTTFNKQTVLNAWWSIIDNNGKEVFKNQTKLSIPTKDDYPSLIKSQSKIINELAKQITNSILKLPSPSKIENKK